MILNIIIAILAVGVSTGLISWAIVWGVRSSMSEESAVRRRFRAAEVVMSLAIAALSAATAQNAKERKLAVLVIGFVMAAWLFRGAKLLLDRRKA